MSTAFEYQTARGHAYSFSGWAEGEQPSECFDREDWLSCLHGCMLCAQFEPDTRSLVADDGVLHELLHLAMGVDISTHNSRSELRREIAGMESRMERLMR